MDLLRLINIAHFVSKLRPVNRLRCLLYLAAFLLYLKWFNLRLFLLQMVVLSESSPCVFGLSIILGKLLVEWVVESNRLILFQLFLVLVWVPGVNTLVIDLHLLCFNLYFVLSRSFPHGLSVLWGAVFHSEVGLIACYHCHLGIPSRIWSFLVVSIVARWQALFRSDVVCCVFVRDSNWCLNIWSLFCLLGKYLTLHIYWIILQVDTLSVVNSQPISEPLDLVRPLNWLSDLVSWVLEVYDSWLDIILLQDFLSELVCLLLSLLLLFFSSQSLFLLPSYSISIKNLSALSLLLFDTVLLFLFKLLFTSLSFFDESLLFLLTELLLLV